MKGLQMSMLLAETTLGTIEDAAPQGASDMIDVLDHRCLPRAVHIPPEQTPCARRLRALRQKRGLTLKQLAARAGLSRQWLNMIELGRHPLHTSYDPDDPNRIGPKLTPYGDLLAKALGVRLEDLIGIAG